jgi:4-hydroxybenzoate polyprenyltransferase
MRSIISDYARLLRLPGLGGLSIAPVFGALSLWDVYETPLPQLVILFFIGALSAIYGFVLNDYADVEIDKLSKELANRPLVKGTITKKTALAIVILCFILTFIIIFSFFYKPQTSFYLGVICILLAAVFGSIYNLYGKRFIGSDFIVALSEAFLVLFGALIVLQNGSLTIFTGIIFILTFNQLVYMNAVEGGLKDADHDYLKNVKNIALASGVKVTKENQLILPPVFKAFGLGIRTFSAVLVFIPLLFYTTVYHYELWQILLLILCVISVFYLSIKLLTITTFNRSTIRKLIAKQTFLRYSLVPLMLLPVIGPLPAIILIIFPFLWYLIFTPLIGEKIFQPRI